MPGRRRADSIRLAPDERAKRLKTDSDAKKYVGCFADDLLDAESVGKLSEEYKQSIPFLHVVVDKLLQNDLLTKVRDECLGELSFSEKETDIYKVRAPVPFDRSLMVVIHRRCTKQAIWHHYRTLQRPRSLCSQTFSNSETRCILTSSGHSCGRLRDVDPYQAGSRTCR